MFQTTNQMKIVPIKMAVSRGIPYLKHIEKIRPRMTRDDPGLPDPLDLPSDDLGLQPAEDGLKDSVPKCKGNCGAPNMVLVSRRKLGCWILEFEKICCQGKRG